MRSLFITDIHCGYAKPGRRFGDQAVPLMREHFLSYANATLSTDDPVQLVVNGGDEGTKVDRGTDLKNRYALSRVWGEINADIHQSHIPGNYELNNLSWRDNEEFYGHCLRSHYVDVDNIRHVMWMADVTKTGNDFVISLENLIWLQNILDHSPHDVIVYHHLPLTNTPEEIARIGSQAGVNPHWYLYKNGEAAQQIIASSGKVVLSLAGHRHRFEHLQIGRTNFLTVPSFTQAVSDKEQTPALSFAECRTKGKELSVTIHGGIQPTAPSADALRHIKLN